MRYLWDWFVEIHRGRSGMDCATHLDLYAWQRNRGIQLRAWELKAIMRLGNLAAVAISEAMSSTTPT